MEFTQESGGQWDSCLLYVVASEGIPQPGKGKSLPISRRLETGCKVGIQEEGLKGVFRQKMECAVHVGQVALCDLC